LKKLRLPLILGAALGLISVLLGPMPTNIEMWSGLRVVGNNVGYLLGALTAALYALCAPRDSSDPRDASASARKKWLEVFLSSSFAIIVATVIYYSLIFILGLCGAVYAEDLPQLLTGTLWWSVIDVVCGALSATAMLLLIQAKTKLARYGTIAAVYLALLFVVYRLMVVRMINIHRGGVIYESLAGGIFEIAFAVALITVFCVVAFRKTKAAGKTRNDSGDTNDT